MNELSVIINQKPGTIEFNFEELKMAAQARADLYKGIVVTEDTVKASKSDIADLRAFQKDINSKRIEVKKKFMEPLDAFEKLCKEAVSIINKVIIPMDKQVKDFEEKKKAEKKQEIRKSYDALVGEMAEYLPFEKIYDPRWENTNVSTKSIKESIAQLVDSTSMAVQTIKCMNSEYITKALEQYKLDLSLPNAIASINRYEAQRKEILEREEKRKAEEERKAKEKAEAEEIAKRKEEKEEECKRMELEIEANTHKILLNTESELAVSDAEPDVDMEAPFGTYEQPFTAYFTAEQPFVVTKKKTVFEVIVDEDLETTLISFAVSIGAECRRIS
jgi:hypothetical protein